MEHRIIGLIVSGCIIFVAVIAIVIKYFLRNKKSSAEEKVKAVSKKIQESVTQNDTDEIKQ